MTPPFAIADACWLAHRYIESEDKVRFVRVERARHDEVAFLTDDCLGPVIAAPDVPMAQCLQLPGDGPLNFIFHSAFCASTLLTRAFDRPGLAMGLSEPVILNDAVGFRRRGARGPDVARVIDGATRLLARPFAAGEAVVVKPSNIFNTLADAALMLRPQSRALFLYAPLATFLISVVRKGLPCRLWVRELIEGLILEGATAGLGFESHDWLRLTDLQVAAVGWLVQHRLFAALAQKHGAQRLMTLDADRMLADPAGRIGAVAAHFGLVAGGEELASGPAFARHSKSGESFDAKARDEGYRAAHAAHANEIDRVVAWAQAVADNAGVPLALPNAI